MKIQVERLGESPTTLVFEGGGGFWSEHVGVGPALPGGPAGSGATLVVHLDAHRMGDDLLLEGRLEIAPELECGRCLARYRHALCEPFRLVLEPAGARIPADPEAAAALARDGICFGEDIETGWYRGSEIDLSHFFAEVIALALPVQPLCREDCAGLCPRCGADRNAVACGCPEIVSHSPFAALAALQGTRTRGDD